MKSYITCALLLLVQLASADRVININNQTDKALEKANKLLTRKGLGIIPLPSQIIDRIQLYKGFLVGSNSMARTKDATVTLNEGATNVTVDIHYGLRLYTLVFGLFKLNDDWMTGVFSVKKNSIHFSFTMINQTNCQVKLNNLEYETLTDATFESSLPKYKGDVSKVFENTVLPEINKKLNAEKHQVEKALEVVICRRHHQDFHDVSHLSEILSQNFLHI